MSAQKEPSMPDESIERRDFEEWVSKTYPFSSLARQDTGYSFPGEYVDTFVKSMWIAWFERASQPKK